jgi:hypothetical protein
MPKVKQLTAWTENRPGRLAEVAAALGEKKLDIRAFWAGLDNDRWALRMIVDKPAAAKKLLIAQGWDITEEEVVLVAMVDKPGSLGEVAAKLEGAGINIDYAYSSRGERGREVNTYFAVTDVAAAVRALR